jgi:hypothetical protein
LDLIAKLGIEDFDADRSDDYLIVGGVPKQPLLPLQELKNLEQNEVSSRVVL